MRQVLAHQDQFAISGVSIVTISFAIQPYWAEAWLAETQSPFPLLLDPARQAYREFGLQRSTLRSWGLRNLAYYAKAKWRGEELIGEKRGDTAQLGGDFIIRHDGTVHFAQVSQDPTDRPPLSKLRQLIS